MNGEQRKQEDFVHCFVPIRETELMLQEAEHFMKKTIVSALTTMLVAGTATASFAAANPFSDVPADHWAYDAVS